MATSKCGDPRHAELDERPAVSTTLFAYLLVALSGAVVGFCAAAFLGVLS